MSKTTNAQAPGYPVGGSLSINGVPVSTSTYSDGIVKTNVNLTPSQKNAYNYAQEEFANNLDKINVFSPQTLQNLNSQVQAYKNNGIQNINEIYTPMLKNLKNDVASRFGSLNNSIFLDNLDEIEDKRKDSVSALSQDIMQYQNTLQNEELQNQYNYLNFLNNYQNQLFSNAMSMGSSSQNGLNYSGNYQNQVNSANNQTSALSSQLASVLLNRYNPLNFL